MSSFHAVDERRRGEFSRAGRGNGDFLHHYGGGGVLLESHSGFSLMLVGGEGGNVDGLRCLISSLRKGRDGFVFGDAGEPLRVGG